METVRRQLRRRRLWSVLVSVCAVAALLLTAFSAAARPVYMPYSPEGVLLEKTDDGLLLTISGARFINYSQIGVPEEEEPHGTIAEVTAWYTLLDRVQNDMQCSTLLSADSAVWYVDLARDGAYIPLTGETSEHVGMMALPRLTLNYYVLIAAAAAVVCFALWFPLRGTFAGRVFRRLGTFGLGYVAAHFLVTHGQGQTWDVWFDLFFILTIALCLWGLVTAGEAILRQRRRDRA